MRISSKHPATKTIQFVDFSGGLNLAVPPEVIANNECVALYNFEFEPSSGVLKTREGLEKLGELANSIDSMYYGRNIQQLLVMSDNQLYKYSTGTFTLIGSLSGTKTPIYCEWENKVLIASGGALQSYDGTTLTTISGAPNSDYVNVQYGRVIVSQEGSDYLYWSGVGDETQWDFTSNKALMLEVGYKDGGNIIAVQMLSRDIVVFKDNGRIYRVVGPYPDWVVYEVANKVSGLSRLSTTSIGDYLVFLDSDGVKTLQTVMEYGDLRATSIGDKINKWIVKNTMKDYARLWHSKRKGQVWIRAQDDKFVYVYHYLLNAWTIFYFKDQCNALAEDAYNLYVALGNILYKMNDLIHTDNGESIQSRLITKRLFSNFPFLVKKIKFAYEGLEDGSVNIQINNYYRNITIQKGGDIAYSDNDIAYLDNDPVVFYNRHESQKRTNFRTPYLQPEIVVIGAIRFLGLIIEIVEV